MRSVFPSPSQTPLPSISRRMTRTERTSLSLTKVAKRKALLPLAAHLVRVSNQKITKHYESGVFYVIIRFFAILFIRSFGQRLETKRLSRSKRRRIARNEERRRKKLEASQKVPVLSSRSMYSLYFFCPLCYHKEKKKKAYIRHMWSTHILKEKKSKVIECRMCSTICR